MGDKLRNARGNMLFLCVAIGCLILVLTGIAFWFQLVFFSNQRLQDAGERFALIAAQKLNENDNVGRLNNLTADSRELVFSARQIHDVTLNNPHCKDYEKLAAQYVEQAREGARLVGDERQRLVNSTVRDMRKLVNGGTAALGREVELFDAAVDRPEIIDFKLGSLDNMESNVRAPQLVPDLLAYDQAHSYLKKGKDFDFYLAGKPLRLPAPDEDIDFLLSPLPMAVNDTAAPMRLVSEKHFKPAISILENGNDAIGSCKIMPSCVQVLMSVRMKSKVVDKVETGTKSLSTACTNGALPLAE
jgi:hypothetical protein